ncbi:MAG: hypothetical protein Fur0032_24920 [Terrimicrobiaceae bacterium]
MGKTIWILGDQLHEGHSGLAQADPRRDRVLMIESRARGSHLRYHKIKLAMVYAAMRHFAEKLRKKGWQVDYHRMVPDFESGLRAHISKTAPDELVLMEPNSWQETDVVGKLSRKLDLPVRYTPTAQFLRSRQDFMDWAGPRSRLLMETHYREMRRRTGTLMQADGSPEGGAWNLDSDNRKTARDYEKAGSPRPNPVWQPPRDKLTRSAISDVEKFFPEAPGSAEELWVPVTREEAQTMLDDFITQRLPPFGAYEDLMMAEDGQIFHSLLSAPINMGLLDPMECVRAAEAAYHSGHAPLNSVEGFVRQIIGWREFINGIYWLNRSSKPSTGGKPHKHWVLRRF